MWGRNLSNGLWKRLLCFYFSDIVPQHHAVLHGNVALNVSITSTLDQSSEQSPCTMNYLCKWTSLALESLTEVGQGYGLWASVMAPLLTLNNSNSDQSWWGETSGTNTRPSGSWLAATCSPEFGEWLERLHFYLGIELGPFACTPSALLLNHSLPHVGHTFWWKDPCHRGGRKKEQKYMQ